MMHKYLRIIVGAGLILYSSCREIYEPELPVQPSVLVVDGLITNELREHTINLTRAVKFDTSAYIPETKATVYVQDNKGNIANFNETTPGRYVSDKSSFKPVVGFKYTLVIKTQNGKFYKSEEQELLPPGNIGDIDATPKKIPHYFMVDNKMRIWDVAGAEFSVSYNVNKSNSPYYRFSNTLMAEFYSKVIDSVNFCFRKYESDVNFTLSDIQVESAGTFQQRLGFLPIENTFYGIVDHFTTSPEGDVYTTRELFHYYITIKQFHLNKTTFEAYRSMNQQLSASQKIFDPVTAQLKGNVKCITDTKELVLGLFEVSSVNTKTFIVDQRSINNVFKLYPIRPIDLDTIPHDGFNYDIPPRYWIYDTFN
jgi:hypothetical protein